MFRRGQLELITEGKEPGKLGSLLPELACGMTHVPLSPGMEVEPGSWEVEQ